MNIPRVSIGMPIFNGEAFIEVAIESILGQDFQDFELIISDNGSTDQTQAICNRFAARDNRIRYYRNETNRGAAWNYNQVFELARGEYFKWQAHDDVCLPTFLSRCIEIFDAAPESVVVVYPRTEIIDADGKHLPQFQTESIDSCDENPSVRLAKVLKNLNMACAVFGLMRSSALRQTRLIGRFIASDYVLLSELAMIGELREVPETLFQRRVHSRISTYASQTHSDLLQWFDPSQKRYRKLIPPMIWLGTEYFRSVFHVPLGRFERIRCLVTACRVWYFREFRNIGGRYKARLIHALAAKESG